MSRTFRFLLCAVLVTGIARAEGVSDRDALPSSATRLRGTSSLVPMPDGGLLSLGGSSLRLLPPGAKRWETLHQVPKGNLYRVSVNDAGGVLAAWESEPVVHYLLPRSKRHVTLPRPSVPPPGISGFGLQYLAFATNGRDALIRMEGSTPHRTGPSRGERKVYMLYRVPLDGTGAPELLYTVDGAQLVQMGPRVAAYLIPTVLGPTCDAHMLCEFSSLIAYELTNTGVTQKTLLTQEQVRMAGARRVTGSDDDRLVLQIETSGARHERGLLTWRRGDAKADYRPLPGRIDDANRLLVMKSGALVELVKLEEDALEIRHTLPDGRQTTTRLRAPEDLDTVDSDPHGIGERGDGTLWAHWGDYVLLFPPGTPPRAYSIASLLGRRDDWAGVDLYVSNPESLWVGVEIGAGRDFVRVPFAQLEKGAKPWPTE